MLGAKRAELLMSQVPRYDVNEIATKDDPQELRTEIREGLAAVNQRLDRQFLTLVAGPFVIVAAMIGLFAAVA